MICDTDTIRNRPDTIRTTVRRRKIAPMHRRPLGAPARRAGRSKSPPGGAPLEQKARSRGVRKAPLDPTPDPVRPRLWRVSGHGAFCPAHSCRRHRWFVSPRLVGPLKPSRWRHGGGASTAVADAPAQRACRASSTSAPQAAPPLTRRLGFKQQRFFQLWRLEEPTTTYPPALRPVDMLRSNCGARPAAAFIAACKAARGGGVPPPPSRLAWRSERAQRAP